jgi:hypothetical protein
MLHHWRCRRGLYPLILIVALSSVSSCASNQEVNYQGPMGTVVGSLFQGLRWLLGGQ